MCFLNFYCRLSCKKVGKKNYYFFGNFDKLQFVQDFFCVYYFIFIILKQFKSIKFNFKKLSCFRICQYFLK